MKYVVIGASAAGISGIRELRRIDPNSEIILISKDKTIYSRCILHHYLGGIRNLKELNFTEDNFEELYRVEWIKGMACTGVNPKEKKVILEDKREIAYDKLLIATGSHTYIPPVKNLKEAKNVIGFRDIEDVERLKEEAKTRKNFLVLGGGLVGLDCITGLMELGVNVTMLEMGAWLLCRQLDERAAATYQEAFSKKGVKQYYNVKVAEAVLDEAGEVTAVILDDGTKISCDYVVVAAGVASNIEFLEGSGLKTTQSGLFFDESGKTSDADVYAAGDVSGMRPIWPAAVKEGIIAASNMAGEGGKLTDFFATKATMNILGIPCMSLGDVNPKDDAHIVEIREDGDSYKKIVHCNGKITGAILQGDLAYGGILQQLIANKIDVSKVKKPIFDVDYSDFFHMKENFEFYYED
ncbi:MAG: FAD-dependent oxidoreductase [Clostridiales bacterium]|nr:FAD-dependent oxidoreductase [Clostridiales bacterium]